MNVLVICSWVERCSSLLEASDDPGNRGERAVRILDAHRSQPELLCRIAVVAWEIASPTNIICLSGIPLASRSILRPYALSTPFCEMSIEVF